MYNLAIRKCTSPPLLAPRLKIFKLKFITLPGQTCYHLSQRCKLLFYMYVKKKWGYKVVPLCGFSGVLLNFEIYTGKEEHASELPDVGVSGNVVVL